jgi:hypothetical protein
LAVVELGAPWQPAARKRIISFSVSPSTMFIPSLPWSNDRVVAKKWHCKRDVVFSYLGSITCEKRHSFLNFPYVCPEPVLVKNVRVYI